MAIISIFIPIYRESRILGRVLGRLANQDVDKEIFVVIDEPSRNTLRIVREFRGKASFIINRGRVGKVNALNEAVKRSRGQILLFLDGDVEIPRDRDFLRRIIDEMEDTDILDLRKEIVGSSFLSRMMYYEYIGLNIYSWLTLKLIGKSPAINGAAFAIRRDVFNSLNGFRRVISEDLDLATRAFLGNYRFKYAGGVKVYNHAYLSWKDWIQQRKRWAIGAILWFKEWYRDLLRICIKHPRILAPTLLILLPPLVASTSFLVPDQLTYEVLATLLLLFMARFNYTLPALLLIIPGIRFINEVSALLLSLLATSLLYLTLSRKLKFKFRVYEFIIYSLLYMPLYLAIIAIYLAQTLILKREFKLDWKV